MFIYSLCEVKRNTDWHFKVFILPVDLITGGQTNLTIPLIAVILSHVVKFHEKSKAAENDVIKMGLLGRTRGFLITQMPFTANCNHAGSWNYSFQIHT